MIIKIKPRMPPPVGGSEFPVFVMWLVLTISWQVKYQNYQKPGKRQIFQTTHIHIATNKCYTITEPDHDFTVAVFIVAKLMTISV